MRDFLREHSTDVNAVIINKAAADYIGLENPVGETIKANGMEREIIGVIEDVVATSPYEAVAPGFYWLDKNIGSNSLSQMIIRLNPENASRYSPPASGR